MEEQYHETNNRTPVEEDRAAMRDRLIGPEASRALAFQTVAVRHFGPAAGIFLRQLLYRDGNGKWDANFWIYKSMKEWDQETGLKRRQQEKARKVLVGKGVMEEKHANGPDGRQRLFFRVDPWAVMEALGDDLPHAQPSTSTQGCTVLPDKDHVQYYRAGTMPDSSAQAIQKTTQKTTQKIYSRRGEQSSPGLREEIKEEEIKEPHRTDTYMALVAKGAKDCGEPLEERERDKIAGNIKWLIEEGATAENMNLAIGHMLDYRVEGKFVLPSQMLEDNRAFLAAQDEEDDFFGDSESATIATESNSPGPEDDPEGYTTPEAVEAQDGALNEAVSDLLTNPYGNRVGRLALAVVEGKKSGENPITREHVAEALRDELDLSKDEANNAADQVIEALRDEQKVRV